VAVVEIVVDLHVELLASPMIAQTGGCLTIIVSAPGP
jgi:hypothetical protein